MPSLITAAIFLSLGVLCFCLVGIVANLGGPETRRTVGTFYYKQSARIRNQFAILRRVLSGYDMLPISLDNEQKLLKVTLDSNYLNEDNEFPFKDPDNRILRLFNKPVALCFELVPAAIDAELSEIGHFLRRKRNETGLWTGEFEDADQWEGDQWTGRVDPFVDVPDGLHLVDPLDAFELVPNDVDPENVKTAEKLTQERFSRYGPRVSLESTLAAVIGYLVGIGSVAGVNYIQQNLLDGGGGDLGGHVIDVPTNALVNTDWLTVLAVIA